MGRLGKTQQNIKLVSTFSVRNTHSRYFSAIMRLKLGEASGFRLLTTRHNIFDCFTESGFITDGKDNPTHRLFIFVDKAEIEQLTGRTSILSICPCKNEEDGPVCVCRWNRRPIHGMAGQNSIIALARYLCASLGLTGLGTSSVIFIKTLIFV